MSRNFNLGTRDMAGAGRKALHRACVRGEMSFSSVDAVADRWSLFCHFAKSSGIGRMERIMPQLLIQYGQDLARQVRQGEMSPAYAQNLVSAVNTVMQLVCSWPQVSPTTECGIPKRSIVRKVSPGGIDWAHLRLVTKALRDSGFDRGATVVELARSFGLRSKEASLINANTAFQQAQSDQEVTISVGTKGGKVRRVPITTFEQLSTLQKAALIQGADRALIPATQTWKQWREGELRLAREALQAHGIARLHDLRAAYACQRYQALTGHEAPVVAGRIVDNVKDMQARQVISKELGHGDERLDVVAAYIGGR